jgi:hypothetical protein
VPGELPERDDGVHVREGGGGGGGVGTTSTEHLASNPSRKGIRINRINTKRTSKRTKSNINH